MTSSYPASIPHSCLLNRGQPVCCLSRLTDRRRQQRWERHGFCALYNISAHAMSVTQGFACRQTHTADEAWGTRQCASRLHCTLQQYDQDIAEGTAQASSPDPMVGQAWLANKLRLLKFPRTAFAGLKVGAGDLLLWMRCSPADGTGGCRGLCAP